MHRAHHVVCTTHQQQGLRFAKKANLLQSALPNLRDHRALLVVLLSQKRPDHLFDVAAHPA